MEDVPAVLLAGGLGTRLGPSSATLPKALVPVAGRPFVDHQLAFLRRSGIRRVVLCLRHLGDQVEAHLGSSAHGLALEYSYDGPRPLGTGGALRRAAARLGPVAWVFYGDSYTDVALQPILAAFEKSAAPGLMTVLRNEGRWDRSNVLFEAGRLVRYDKHAPTSEMAHIDYGVSLLRRVAIERIPEDGPYDLAELFRALVGEGGMIGFEVAQRFYEIGTPEGLAETRAFLEGRAVENPR